VIQASVPAARYKRQPLRVLLERDSDLSFCAK
jgi:hypothetical protein